MTSNPEINRSGPTFLVPSADEVRRLDKGANPDSIYMAQIPENYTLDQIEGACPGMEGEVHLIYYPLKEPENRVESGWKQVDAGKICNYGLPKGG